MNDDSESDSGLSWNELWITVRIRFIIKLIRIRIIMKWIRIIMKCMITQNQSNQEIKDESESESPSQNIYSSTVVQQSTINACVRL